MPSAITNNDNQHPVTQLEADKKAFIVMSVAGGAFFGAVTGAAFGPVGILAGAVVGAVVGAFTALAILAINAPMDRFENRNAFPKDSVITDAFPKDLGITMDWEMDWEAHTKKAAANNILRALEKKDSESFQAEGIGRVGNSNQALLNRAEKGESLESLESEDAVTLLANLKSLFNNSKGPSIMISGFDAQCYQEIQELIDAGKDDEAIVKIRDYLRKDCATLSERFIRILNKVSLQSDSNKMDAANLNVGGFATILLKNEKNILNLEAIMKDVRTRGKEMAQSGASKEQQAPAVGTFIIQNADKIFAVEAEDPVVIIEPRNSWRAHFISTGSEKRQ